MPNLKLTNLTAYRNYFADIATKHVAIDGFKWGDKDVVRNDNRSDLPTRFLWAKPYMQARYGDNNSDNVVKTKTAEVGYLLTPDSELFADEDEAFDAAEAVIEQILARILKDKRGEMVEGEWTMLVTDIKSWTTSPIEHKLGSTKYVGWELKINFMDNTNLAFDASKWDE